MTTFYVCQHLGHEILVISRHDNYKIHVVYEHVMLKTLINSTICKMDVLYKTPRLGSIICFYNLVTFTHQTEYHNGFKHSDKNSPVTG